jgi:hypothetical protein
MRIERRLGPVLFWYWRWNRGCCLEDFEVVFFVSLQASDFIFDKLQFWVWWKRWLAKEMLV